jgi:hypothetical protein
MVWFLKSWVDAPRCRGQAHSYGHDLARELQLIGFNTDRAAAQLGVSPSWETAAQDKEKWRKLAARLPLAPVETKTISEHARTERTGSLSMLSRRPVQLPPPGRNDCGPVGRTGATPYRRTMVTLTTAATSAMVVTKTTAAMVTAMTSTTTASRRCLSPPPPPSSPRPLRPRLAGG